MQASLSHSKSTWEFLESSGEIVFLKMICVELEYAVVKMGQTIRHIKLGSDSLTSQWRQVLINDTL